MAIWDIDEEWDTELTSGDPLSFAGYRTKLDALDHESVRTGLGEGCVVISGDFSVLGGSMGVVHGEKVVRAVDRAVAASLPLVVVTRSGGARMQEGMVSLVQMGRTTAAMNRHAAAGLLSVAVHRNPTTGGVFVSYGSLCDLAAVEAGATIGFAGPRVAETVTGEPVAGRSHTAESAHAAGLVDAVGELDALDSWVRGALGRIDAPLVLPRGRATRVAADLAGLDGGRDDRRDGGSEAWGTVCAARHESRPGGLDVAATLVRSWTELASTDPTLRAGLARIDGLEGPAGDRVVVIAHDRHTGTGRTGPAGLRLARRAIALAARIGLPILTLIDTPGAEPGSDAELDGVGHEIAHTFRDLLDAAVPTVAICVGEGGSGGALALGVTDRLLIQRNAIFSVIGPEGAASILHRDAGRAPEVAGQLRLTSGDLVELGIVDAVIDETPAAVHAAVITAFAEATVGDRNARPDAASARWVIDTSR